MIISGVLLLCLRFKHIYFIRHVNAIYSGKSYPPSFNFMIRRLDFVG